MRTILNTVRNPLFWKHYRHAVFYFPPWEIALFVVLAVLFAWLFSPAAKAHETASSHYGSHAYHRGIERLWNPDHRGYRYWDGPLSDEGTRYYGENGGTVHYGY